MRRQLILVFLAVSTLVATAFVVPLGFVVQRTAQDRGIDAARADAAAMIPSLVSGETEAQIEAALLATSAGAAGRMTVATAAGTSIGPTIGASEGVSTALESGASSINDLDDGVEVVTAVASGPGDLSAIRVYVPDEILHRGRTRAWSVLAGVGLALIAVSVLVADRLSHSIVRPTRQLAAAARQLGSGDLTARVDPEGPPEIAELARSFNDLGSRISSMLDQERELVAELSHRLRTPLTKLRLRTGQIRDPELAAALSGDIDELTAEVNALIGRARAEPANRSSCDLNELAIDRAAFWEVLAEDQGRPWRFDTEGDALLVRADRSDLAAAIDALLENVFSHTPESAMISIECGRVDGNGELVIGDGGPGFRPSAVVRGRSGSDSTGLGLAIASRTVERSGGRLTIDESALGGARISLSLPLLDSGEY